jgi:hypothetical protein
MTNEEAMRICTDMGLHEGGMENWVMDNAWVKFGNIVERNEREECAKLCEANGLFQTCEAIRERGKA